ncbi:hypothetical protein [Cohnella rhizosphaerae]|uniref:hypothetical protein n=1 Tax=Cohnella rhizosphaerae TaxID=1457232 RepID=UPI0030B8C7AF
MPAVGSHVSTRRGFYEAARAASRMGGDAFQYFPSNPRTLFSKPVDEGGRFPLRGVLQRRKH